MSTLAGSVAGELEWLAARRHEGSSTVSAIRFCGSRESGFALAALSQRDGQRIRNGEWPHHGEALEHGFDGVVHFEAVASRLTREVAAMGGEPPVEGAVALALVPGKAGVDRVERFDFNLNGAPDAPWRTGAIDHDNEITDSWQAPIGVVAYQRRRRSLGAGDHQRRQLGCD